VILGALAKQEINWLKSNPPAADNVQEDGIVMSSRVRLARNLSNQPFPLRADRILQLSTMDKVVSAVQSINLLSNAYVHKLNDLDKIDRLLLMERHLISHEHASNINGGPGLVFTRDETISIMVNEEDHLRMQVITPGLSPKIAWKTLNEIDDGLNEKLKFAFHPRWGYLTACPTNIGTGMRVSCLMHLPGLVITNEIEGLFSGWTRVGLRARGCWGVGAGPLGDIFQISNAVTLGKNEESIIDDLGKVVNSIIRYEKGARQKLLKDSLKEKVEDNIYRSYGILSFAKSIETEEAIQHISKLKLGLSLKMKLAVKLDSIDQLIFTIQPAHLQEIVGRELTAEQRDATRAELIRKSLIN